MASRSISADVIRLLERATSPLCLFDQDRRLVFANQACCDWVGVAQGQLIGQIGAYTSITAKNGVAAVDRLCPPPDAFAGVLRSGYVYAAAGDTVKRFFADFVPIRESDDGSPDAVMVLCRSSDANDDEQAPALALGAISNCEAQSLHDRLVRFHHEQCARYRLECIAGETAAIKLAQSQAQAAIASRSSAVIVGPPGSGREHLARTIHYAAIEDPDNRREGRPPLLLPIDGSLLTEDVLSSVVAALSSAGREATATLLVLHADLVPLELQTEILRLFVHRFAGVRFLATADVPLDNLVTQGAMRADFAAASSTIAIRLPPLAERRRDIPLLAQVAVEQLNFERKKQLSGFTIDAMDALVAYSWPGNVAELRSLVSEAFAAADGPEITVTDLPRRLLHTVETTGRPARAQENIVLYEFLAGVERELIERSLRIAKGNKAKAARLLGLTRPRLYRRMVQLGFEEAIDIPAAATARPPVAGRKSRSKPGKQPVLPAATDSDDVSGSETEDEAEFIEDIPFEEQPE